jgi:hypothetical protein
MTADGAAHAIIASAANTKRRPEGRLPLLRTERLEVAVGLAAGGVGAGKRFIHDAANGSKAPSALRAAAQAAMHLPGGPGRCGIARQCPADVMVADHVAGTNNHGTSVTGAVSINRNYCYLGRPEIDFNQNRHSLDVF